MTYLLLNLQSIHYRSQLAENLVGSLVEFELRSNQVCQVPQRLRGVKDLDRVSAGVLSCR